MTNLFEEDEQLYYANVTFKDSEVEDVEDEDDLAFEVESTWNGIKVTFAKQRNVGGKYVWDATVQGTKEALNQMFQDRGVNQPIYPVRDHTSDEWKKEMASPDRTVYDVRTMVLCELSSESFIDSKQLRIPLSEVPGKMRYKTEDVSDDHDMGTDVELVGDNMDYLVHVDSPERLEFAKRVAEVYSKYGVRYQELPPQVWRRDPGERYKALITIPAETDGIDIKKLDKKP